MILTVFISCSLVNVILIEVPTELAAPALTLYSVAKLPSRAFAQGKLESSDVAVHDAPCATLTNVRLRFSVKRTIYQEV